jgi:lysophospholipase
MKVGAAKCRFKTGTGNLAPVTLDGETVPTAHWGSTDLGGTVGTLHASVPLRVAWWSPAAGRRGGEPGTVVVVQGRGEFIEVYAEAVADLLARGYYVVAFDFRGQGGSHRRTAAGGHVSRFEDYVADLAAVVRFAHQRGLPPPYNVLAHSMGGLVALLAAPSLAREVDRMVLLAPLMEVTNLPAPSGLLSIVAGLGSVAGMARRPVGEPGAVPRQFAGNRLTSDPARFETVKALVDSNLELVTGPPTLGWVRAAFQAMNAIRRRTGRPLPIPTLFVASGQDTIVSTPAIDRFARATPGAGLVIVPGARHQILLERDGLRNLFFAAFDAYVGKAQRRLSEVRPPRFTRSLDYEVAASGPPTLVRRAEAASDEVAPLPEDPSASAEVTSKATEARESADALALDHDSASGSDEPAPDAVDGEEREELSEDRPAAEADAPHPPPEEEHREEQIKPAADESGSADARPLEAPPAEPPRPRAPLSRTPSRDGARAGRIRERLLRRARRKGGTEDGNDEPLHEADATGDGDPRTDGRPQEAPDSHMPAQAAEASPELEAVGQESTAQHAPDGERDGDERREEAASTTPGQRVFGRGREEAGDPTRAALAGDGAKGNGDGRRGLGRFLRRQR